MPTGRTISPRPVGAPRAALPRDGAASAGRPPAQVLCPNAATQPTAAASLGCRARRHLINHWGAIWRRRATWLAAAHGGPPAATPSPPPKPKGARNTANASLGAGLHRRAALRRLARSAVAAAVPGVVGAKEGSGQRKFNCRVRAASWLRQSRGQSKNWTSSSTLCPAGCADMVFQGAARCDVLTGD